MSPTVARSPDFFLRAALRLALLFAATVAVEAEGVPAVEVTAAASAHGNSQGVVF